MLDIKMIERGLEKTGKSKGGLAAAMGVRPGAVSEILAGIRLIKASEIAPIMEYLALNSNRIVSRTDIWQHVYDFNASPESNVVDVYIGLLRKKIERPGSPRLIHTRRGQGYSLGEREEAE